MWNGSCRSCDLCGYQVLDSRCWTAVWKWGLIIRFKLTTGKRVIRTLKSRNSKLLPFLGTKIQNPTSELVHSLESTLFIHICWRIWPSAPRTLMFPDETIPCNFSLRRSSVVSSWVDLALWMCSDRCTCYVWGARCGFAGDFRMGRHEKYKFWVLSMEKEITKRFAGQF